MHENASVLPSSKPPPRAGVLAAVIGNGLEFYDFTVFAFFAVPIGRSFFPAQSSFNSLLLSVATFGVGFVTRPLGAAVIGAYADRAGRRPALVLTIALMAVGMTVLALTPGYATLGAPAPCLIVGARLLQGFALGGDVGPASAFLIENAPPRRRGFDGAWQIASQGGSTLVAGLVGLALMAALPDALQDQGWRIAVLLGLAIVPFGFVLRRALPETSSDPAAPTMVGLLGRLVLTQRRVIASGVLICMAATVVTYTGNYMTTYALTTLHLNHGVALGATAVVGAATLLGALAGGWLSDRIGRRTITLASRLASTAVAYPAFLVMGRHPTAAGFYGCVAALTLANAPASAASVVLVAESLPRALRSVGLATTYAIGISVFGGTTQFVITWLIGATGNPLAPAWFLIGTGAIGFAAVLALPGNVKDDGLATGSGRRFEQANVHRSTQ